MHTQFSNVLHYLGYKGAIKDHDQVEEDDEYQYSKLNAVPLLGMYDIFKNYYSNKQEEYCYMNTGVYQVMGVIDIHRCSYNSTLPVYYCSNS